MSTSTFLGTPLTKYEIDDIETDLLNKSARDLEKAKGLQYRQNRERIKRNRLNTLYTVDTKEGFVPSNFKSSKAHRASYTQQSVGGFTDLEDSDIISKNTLRAIKIDRAGLQRSIANIVNALGFMGKRRLIGPVNINTVETKISRNLQGIGFVFDVDKGVEKVEFVKAKEGTNEISKYESCCNAKPVPKGESPGEHTKDELEPISQDVKFKAPNPGVYNTPLRHVNDRQFDLAEMQSYYKHLYGLIVKSVDVKEDLMEKIAKGIEFTTENSKTEKSVEIGRRVEPYTFDNELLQKFKIKTSRFTTGDGREIEGAKDTKECATGPKLPTELFHSIFGK